MNAVMLSACDTFGSVERGANQTASATRGPNSIPSRLLSPWALRFACESSAVVISAPENPHANDTTSRYRRHAIVALSWRTRIVSASSDDIARLIEPGRIHKRVYTDPEIFELEMRRIFGRAWLYVGHESQIPNPGDYITTELGLQPVIMIRHHDNSVRVLINRCAHRGAKVVNERKGNAATLSCLYHGWSYDTDGR